MPCGCGGKSVSSGTQATSSGSTEFVYVNQSGHEVVRGTEMQARAASYRDNEAGTVRPS
jgi:hypothetical protein